MPGGRGKGRGQGRGGGRQRRRHRRGVRGFLQPCLLVLLHRGEAHGYSLLSGLGEFGFDCERLDSSLIYRALRDMEASGLVTSEWGDDSRGPQRRVYSIAPGGELSLTEWMTDLRRTRKEIDSLEAAFQKVE